MALAQCQPLGCCVEAEGPVYGNCCCVDVDVQEAIKAYNLEAASAVVKKEAVVAEKEAELAPV